MYNSVDIEVEERVEVTKGLVKIVSQAYEIPKTIFCPECGNFAELKRFSNTSGRYDCLSNNCRFSLSAQDYIKQELEKAEKE